MDSNSIPDIGKNPEDILEEMESCREDDADWRNGQTWSLVYHTDDELTEFRERAHAKFASENALGASTFPSLRKFENEVVKMTADLLGGDTETVGNVTSGGTESILLAVKTARDWKQKHHNTDKPEIILPETAHPAFSKAAEYFDVSRTVIQTDSKWRAKPDAIAEAISENTALLVGSAPSYPHGVIDPIKDIAAVANEHDVLCHVDSCIGGFVLPFLDDLGYQIPSFDLSVPGVTSISADPHKYGYTAKGASVLLYHDAELRRHQYFAYDGWPGGVYSAPNMTGTRPGGPIASAWAVLNYVGQDGYHDYVAKVMEITEHLMNGIQEIDELQIVSNPDMCIFAFESTADDVHIYNVHKYLSEQDWAVSRQQRPPNIHLSVMPSHAEVVDPFLSDLQTAVDSARDESLDDETAMYGGGGVVKGNGDLEELAIRALDNTYKMQ